MSNKIFRLHSGKEGGPSVALDNYYPREIKIIIPGAEQTVYSTEAGIIHVQALRNRRSCLEFLSGSFANNGFFNITCTRNTIALICLLEGSVAFYSKDFRLNYLPTSHCTLAYIPSGEYHCFTGSSTLQLLVLIPTLTKLKIIEKKLSVVKSLLKRQLKKSTYPSLLTPVPFSSYTFKKHLILSGNGRIADYLTEILESIYSSAIIAEYIRQHEEVSRTPLYQFVHHLQLHLTDHSISNIPLLAKQYNINYRTLIRKFKTLTQSTINAYINNERMKLAHELIITTQTPLKELAKKIGYNDYAHFSKSFKHWFNVTPVCHRLKK